MPSFQPPLLTPEQAAEQLAISVSYLFRLVRTGRLECHDLGNRTQRFSQRAISEFLQSTVRKGPLRSKKRSLLPKSKYQTIAPHSLSVVRSPQKGGESSGESGLCSRKELTKLCR